MVSSAVGSSLGGIPKAKTIQQNFYSTQETFNGMRREVMEQEEILANYVPKKGLYTKDMEASATE